MTVTTTPITMCEDQLYVQVLYDFEYDSDGKKVSMKEGEEFLLLKKTNSDWWQVIRDGDKKPFYAPATYMGEMCKRKKKSFITNDVCVEPNANVQPDESTSNLKSRLTSSISQNSIKEMKRLIIPAPRSKSCDKIDFSSEKRTQHQGLLFNNPLYNVEEDDPLDSHPYTEPDVDYSDSDSANEKYDENENDENGNELLAEQNACVAIVNTTIITEQRVLKEEENLQKAEDKPVYANLPLNTAAQPPSPTDKTSPIRVLHDSWSEYEDNNGRKYYYNSISEEKSWKPPRRKSDKYSLGSGRSSDSSWQNDSCLDFSDASQSPVACSSPTFPVPLGWSQRVDDDSGEPCFINDVTKAKWFSSMDDQGRTYFYQENACESFWQLPEVVLTKVEPCRRDVPPPLITRSNSEDHSSPRESLVISPPPRRTSQNRPSSLADRGVKTRSMVLTDSRSSTLPRNLSSNWAAFTASGMAPLRQGYLNKTKVIEGGKRVRKSWCPSFVVLSDVFLLFYKDMKSAQQVAITGNKPDTVVDLAGVLIEWTPDKSKRKNVFQLSTVFGQQILLQDDNAQTAKEWFDAIRKAISNLPSGYSLQTARFTMYNCEPDLPSPEDTRKTSRFTWRSKNTGSTEDLDTGPSSPTEKKLKIKDKLLQFFLRRPTMESLREKGIIKEEPVFGCNLSSLCAREKSTVPQFVKKCTVAIEKKDVEADGLYRASGNLSHVQKIRFQVNQDRLSCLDEEDDVHVLTGALKMFFRELKEPLIPFKLFEKLLAAIMLPDQPNKLLTIRDLINCLPRQNYDTLKFLFEHLLRVTEHSERNRMHIQNLAIVFGPTLMWAETESANLALDMLHQNQVIELLLLEFGAIFR